MDAEFKNIWSETMRKAINMQDYSMFCSLLK